MSDFGYKSYSPQPETVHWLQCVQQVLSAYKDNWPLTLRQVFYRLVAEYGFDKTEKAYGRLGTYVARARRASLLKEDARGTTPFIPFQAIRDDKLTSRLVTSYDDEGEFLTDIREQAETFMLPRQRGQERMIEFWCEAAGMLPILLDLASPYGIQVSSSGGYDSVTSKHNLAQRVAKRAKDGIATVICHVGDFDGSGEDMCNNLRDDVGTMVYQLTGGQRNNFDIERVALTAEQVLDRNVVTAPPKPSDSRSRQFVDRNWELVEALNTTDISAQLEALTPPELTALLQEAIDNHLDYDAYNAVIEEEQQIREALDEKLSAL